MSGQYCGPPGRRQAVASASVGDRPRSRSSIGRWTVSFAPSERTWP